MRNRTDRTLRKLVWGVLSLAACASCLFALSGREPVLSLHDLASGSGNVLMSCADDDAPGGEPMWCSSPDSPHCIPALPKPPAPEATHGPVATLMAQLPLPTPRMAAVVVQSWPRPRAAHARSLQLPQRLERPPRSV